MAVIPAPPLKTDNLTAGVPAAPAAAKSAIVVEAGFGSAEAAGAVARTAGPAAAGSFSTASYTPGPAANGRLAQPGGFRSAEYSAPEVRSAAVVARNAFSDLTTRPAAHAMPPEPRAADLTPVEILYKPRPLYTDEARRRQTEGEVLVELLFSASGEVRVLRLVRGLGFGLDETALAAAQAIRFHPAARAGVPVDSSAIVHIVFRLAY